MMNLMTCSSHRILTAVYTLHSSSVMILKWMLKPIPMCMFSRFMDMNIYLGLGIELKLFRCNLQANSNHEQFIYKLKGKIWYALDNM